MSDEQKPAEPEVKTFRMGCPHCKKSTDCVVNTPARVLAMVPRNTSPAAKHFKCLECEMGWVVNTGGSFSTSML